MPLHHVIRWMFKSPISSGEGVNVGECVSFWLRLFPFDPGHKIWLFYFFYFIFLWTDSSLNISQPPQTVSTGALSLFSALWQAADDKFIFSQTFYLITVPSRLLVLPLPVCFRGNPSFVSQGSSANWENLKMSTELKQLEHIWSWRVTVKCISQHSRLVITSALETAHCKSSTVKQFPELSITGPEPWCNTETRRALGIAL